MKNLIIALFLLPTISLTKEFQNIEAKTIKGETIKLSSLKGKAILFVNIASRCGYTPQLESLQKLYDRYQDKGLTVVGIPSNDFGGQSPEKNADMAKFCKLNYGVNFPLLSKTSVKGPNKHPLFKFLINSTKNKREISWNFEKFLVDNQGNLLNRFRSGDSPLGNKIISKIQQALK